MINILLIDDVEDNNLALSLLIEEYMEDHDIEESDCNIEVFTDPVLAFEQLKTEKFDILFLDIMMPKMDGLELLQKLRNDTTIHQPIVVISTALGDKKTIDKEREYKANAYMVKPISAKVVTIMLDKYLKVIEENSFDVEDEFEFDFDDFNDFDDENNLDESHENSPLEQIARKSYEHLSASEFMEEYNYNIENINENLEDIDTTTFEIFESADDEVDLDIQLENVLKIFDLYQNFLERFTQLADLYFVINTLNSTLNRLDLHSLDEKQKKNIGKFIKSIVFDLVSFKEQVFEKQETSNIYYMNASIASSCIQIEYLLDSK